MSHSPAPVAPLCAAVRAAVNVSVSATVRDRLSAMNRIQAAPADWPCLWLPHDTCLLLCRVVSCCGVVRRLCSASTATRLTG
jgi:hypothetical protein